MKFSRSKFRSLGKFNLFINIGLLLGILLLIYGALCLWNTRLDLTSTGAFTLSSLSNKVMQKIENEPIKIMAFLRQRTVEREVFKELVKTYELKLKKLEVIIYDPDRMPSMVKKYRVDEYGTVIVELKNRRERFKGISEEKLTNALLKVMRDEKKKLYFVKGHGESSVASEGNRGLSLFARRLHDENYELKNIILSEEGVPQDAACLIVVGPKTDFSEKELKQMEDYQKIGGSILLLVDPVDPETLNRLEKWIRNRGVSVDENIIVDKLGKALGADYLVPVITQYEEHPITKDFSLAALLPVTRSVTISEVVPPGLSVQILAYTSGTSWAEFDVESLEGGQAFLDPSEDVKGPVSVACAVEGILDLVKTEKGDEVEEENKTPFKMLVFGDSDFIINTNVNVSGNRELALTCIAWLINELSLVQIEDRKRPDTPLVLKTQDQQVLFWFPTVYFPSGILLFGGFVRFLRYRKTKKNETD